MSNRRHRSGKITDDDDDDDDDVDEDEDELLKALQSTEPCENCGRSNASIPCVNKCNQVFYCSAVSLKND